MNIEYLTSMFRHHDIVKFSLTGIGEIEYNTIDFKAAIESIESLQQQNDKQRAVLELAREALFIECKRCVLHGTCDKEDYCTVRNALTAIDEALGGEEK